jgi:hypothetical protein
MYGRALPSRTSLSKRVACPSCSRSD